MTNPLTLASAAFFAFAAAAFASKDAGRKSVPEVCQRFENIRTTAYSTGPQHNGRYGARNAIDGPLKSGKVSSAAADWSRWPLGTRFRVAETGGEYIVDDIGIAMAGTGTIDLFKPSEAGVDRWGVRHVTIEVLEWGSLEKSLRILEERTRFAYIRKMVRDLKALDETTAIVVLTGYGSIATAIESLRLGAIHYLSKPVDVDQILA
ncbi:MAG TPA: 3D domain-containing protein, partial [Chthoniobacterales bacterium]